MQHNKDKDTGNETEAEKAKNIFEEEMSRAEEEIGEIKKLKLSKVGQIWEMKKKIVGGKKSPMKTTAIVDPETNKLALSKKQIISVTLKYCKETLNNNKPTEEFKDIILAKKKEMSQRLEETKGNFKPRFKTFQQLIKKFKLSGKRN